MILDAKIQVHDFFLGQRDTEREYRNWMLYTTKLPTFICVVQRPAAY